MDANNGFPPLDNARTPGPEGSEVTRLQPPVEDILELYDRFRKVWRGSPVGGWNWPTMPRLKVFDHLSFSELFDLGDLWHDVKHPGSTGGTEAGSRRAWYEERLWEDFYYCGLQASLAKRWAELYGLVHAESHSSYRRLFGSRSLGNGNHEDNYPPGCDHTTLWRRKRGPWHFSEVLVTQPYFYNLDEMVAFAKAHFLWFWISERPAWHFPRGVFFIEWARPESQFAAQRGPQEADLRMQTIHAWKGEGLLPGPGTRNSACSLEPQLRARILIQRRGLVDG
jgi:hypothetical protein